MIRHHLRILEIISILMFSLLANYTIGLKIDFDAKFDIVAIIKVILLTISSFIFYLTTIKLKDFSIQAKEEYDSETDIEKKAKKSIKKRYLFFYSEQKKYIIIRYTLSFVLVILFFIIEAVVNQFSFRF